MLPNSRNSRNSCLGHNPSYSISSVVYINLSWRLDYHITCLMCIKLSRTWRLRPTVPSTALPTSQSQHFWLQRRHSRSGMKWYYLKNILQQTQSWKTRASGRDLEFMRQPTIAFRENRLFIRSAITDVFVWDTLHAISGQLGGREGEADHSTQVLYSSGTKTSEEHKQIFLVGKEIDAQVHRHELNLKCRPRSSGPCHRCELNGPICTRLVRQQRLKKASVESIGWRWWTR